MVKIIVLSDSHGNKKNLEKLLLNIKYDYVFFLGDGLKDIEKFNETNIKKVCGNCDLFSDEAITRYENIEGFKIMLTHGHDFKTHFSNALLIESAKNNSCDIVCSGHTHKQGKENIDGILFINGGAFKNNEYAILTLEKNKTPQVEFLNQ